MTRREAKRILSARRATDRPEDDPELASALRLASADTELAQWLQNERRFDVTVATLLDRVQPPAGLRNRILNHRSAASHSLTRRLLAVAASIALLLAVGAASWNVLQYRTNQPLAEWQTGSLGVLSSVLEGKDKLDVESSNPETLRSWLKEAHSPSPQSVPRALQRAASVGCKTVQLDDKRVSIICFHATPTQLAHLVTVEQRALQSAPPEHHPQFARHGEWITASWSDQGQSLMLVMKGSEAELRKLLSPTS